MQVHADTHANKDSHISVWAMAYVLGMTRGYWLVTHMQCVLYLLAGQGALYSKFSWAPLAFPHPLAYTLNISLGKDTTSYTSCLSHWL